MDVVVVGIDSNYEEVTRTAWEYRNQWVYPYMERQGFRVKRFDGSLARRYVVAPEVSKPNVDYVTGVGHGLADLYTGDQGDPIFRVGQYAREESERKIVHLLSCQTAQLLGPDFVEHGCRAYFGYDKNFTFTSDNASLFFECDSEIDRGFSDGLTAEQVYRRVHALYSKRIAEMNRAGKVYVAGTLEFDRDHLRAPVVIDQAGNRATAQWGTPNARLE